METRIKPIPAFYCCYLLRSTVRHASLYVGSSPDPARRLAQHNGKVKGGAVRTSRLSLRPWEMTCVVAGFPSNIAALQFEWAWQNAHLTRHISQQERLSFPVTKLKTSHKTGKTRKKPTRPPTSLKDKLSNLHLLLRVPYFSQWPLELRFFTEDVYHAWRVWSERVDGQIRSGIKIHLDLAHAPEEDEEFTSAQRPTKSRKADLIGKGGVEGIDPTYTRYQDVFTKSQFMLDEDDEQKCSVCVKPVDTQHQLFVICPQHECRSMSHLTCLSEGFLQRQGSGTFLPSQGNCLSCGCSLEWQDLMRQASLRIRGEKKVQKILKKKRGSKAAIAAEILEEESEDDDDDKHDLTPADVVDEEEDDDSDRMSVTSFSSVANSASLSRTGGVCNSAPQGQEIVIEDSEDDR